MTKLKLKRRQLFSYIMGIVSILGFIGTLVDSWGIANINIYITSLTFIVFGTGMMVVGNARSILEYIKNGLTSKEIRHITTSVVGLCSVIAGVLVIFGIVLEGFELIKGVIAIIAIILVINEAFIE